MSAKEISEEMTHRGHLGNKWVDSGRQKGWGLPLLKQEVPGRLRGRLHQGALGATSGR